jgi:hypothetical protein
VFLVRYELYFCMLGRINSSASVFYWSKFLDSYSSSNRGSNKTTNTADSNTLAPKSWYKTTRCHKSEEHNMNFRLYANITAVSVSSFGAKTGYELEDRSPIPGRSKRFLFPRSYQICSGAHPINYTIGTGRYFPWIERSERDTDRSAQATAEVKNSGAITLLPHTSSRCKHRENFTFYLSCQ